MLGSIRSLYVDIRFAPLSRSTLIDRSRQLAMFPSDSTIRAFATQHPLSNLGKQQDMSYEQPLNQTPKRREPFPAWSAIDEAKKTADSMAKEAAREFDIASQKAQQKTGKIEPWTFKYYAACTFGGVLACVSNKTVEFVAV